MKFGNIDLQSIGELRNANIQNLASAPTTNLKKGRIYFNTTDNTLYVYNGTAWIDALSQGDYTFQNGLELVTNTRNVQIKIAGSGDAGNVSLTADSNGLAGSVDLSGKVDKLSTAPTAGNYTKVTINSDGLVTSGTTLSASDIPNLSLSKITDVTATASEVNVLDGITATTTELNYTDGVTSNIQTQLDNKLAEKPDGTNNLIDSNNKITTGYLPDVIVGQLLYAGTFVPSTATATLTTNAKAKLGTTASTIVLTNDTTPITGYEANEGCYYICSGDGTFASLSLLTGDWLVSTGSGWTKIDNTDAVTGVKGGAETNYRTGNVNITADNVLPSQVGNSGKFLTTDGTNSSWGSIDLSGFIKGYTAQNTALTVSGGICTWVVTHNLNTTTPAVHLYEVETGDEVMYDRSITSANAVTISILASANISADTYKVVVLG